MHSSGQPQKPATRALTAVYGGAGIVWMALSEWLMLAIAPGWEGWSRWHGLKPWLDVALATGLFYYLLCRYQHRVDLTQPQPELGAELGVDVTEYRRLMSDRARLEQALSASEAKVRSLIQDVDLGIVLHGGQSEILLCNQTAQDWLGCSTAELTSKPWLDHDWSICREDGSPFLPAEDPVAVAIATHRPVRNVVMGITRKTEGDRIWLLVSAVPQIDASGTLHSVVSSFSNITAQKQAEAALKAERDLLTSIMNTSVAAIMVLNPSGQITYANESAEWVVGLTRTDIASRTYNAPDWKHSDLDGGPWPHEKQPFVQVMTTGQPVFDVQHAIETQTGERKYLSINGAPIKDPQGTITSLVFSVHDITDRFLAERALEHRERYFKALTEHSSDIVVLLDDQGRFSYVTPSAERVLGYCPDVVVGHRAADFVHPDDVATILTVLDNAIRRPRQNQPLVECRVRHANDSYRTFEAVTTSLLDDPIVQGVVVNCRDVTDRKQAEEALQESEERYRSVVSLLTEGVVLHAIDGTIVAHNASAESILGMSMAEMTRHRQIEDPIWQVTDEQGASLPVAHWPAAITLRTGKPQTGVTLGFRRPDGQFRWLMVNSQPLLSPDETSIRGAVVSFSDITERKRAEASIQQLNAALAQQNSDLEALVEQRTSELTTFFNALPDRIFVIDRRDMRIVFSNDLHAWHNFGASSGKEICGKTIFECFPPERAAHLAKQNQQVFTSGEVMRIQHDYKVGDRTIYMDTYKIPLKRPNGEVYALIGSGRDISELVEVRQALMARTVELEATNHELNSFSYSVSHDLRAPLRHLSGFVTALREELARQGVIPAGDRPAPGSDEAAAIAPAAAGILRYLTIIEDSNRKMAMLIDGLLTLSRVGRRQMERRSVPLQPLVEHAIAIVSSDPQVSQRTEFIVDALPTVQGDAALLQQVFSNLIENSVKFSRDRQPARIHIGSLPDGTVFVADNGVGFDMTYADQLFGAFQRLHSKQEFAGTGIGLAIVQRIIHRHGGTIWAESVPTQGATFYIKFALP